MLCTEVSACHNDIFSLGWNQGSVRDLIIIVNQPEHVWLFSIVQFNRPRTPCNSVWPFSRLCYICIFQLLYTNNASGLPHAYFTGKIIHKAVLTSRNVFLKECRILTDLLSGHLLSLRMILHLADIKFPAVPAIDQRHIHEQLIRTVGRIYPDLQSRKLPALFCPGLFHGLADFIR